MPKFDPASGALASATDKICPVQHGEIRIDDAFSLRLGRIHELMGDAADMFAVLVSAQMSGPIVWIGLNRDISSLAPTALERYLDPSRVVVTEVASRKEGFWACEQALRTRGSASVVFETETGPDLRESRRLQIAAEQSGCLGLVIISGRAQTSAAQTRWACVTIDDPDTTWTWHRIKNRAGQPGAWRVRYRREEDAAGTLHLSAAAPV